MARRELVLTQEESVTKAGVTTNFNISLINNLNLDMPNESLRVSFDVGYESDSTFMPMRNDHFTISNDSTYQSIVDGNTDSQIQDGVFDYMIANDFIGAGTKRDSTSV